MAGTDAGPPIVSTLAGDAAAHDRLEGFVVALGETIDRMQDLEAAGAFDALADDARRLGSEATVLGFAPLGEAAALIERRCLAAVADADASKALRDAVVEITDVARRVRLGHRGVSYY